MKLLLFCLLLLIYWPAALAIVILYPIVWLVLLPFRAVGIAVHGVLDVMKAVLFLPGRILRAV